MSVRRSVIPHNQAQASAMSIAELRRRVSVLEGNPFIRKTSDAQIHGAGINGGDFQADVGSSTITAGSGGHHVEVVTPNAPANISHDAISEGNHEATFSTTATANDNEASITNAVSAGTSATSSHSVNAGDTATSSHTITSASGRATSSHSVTGANSSYSLDVNGYKGTASVSHSATSSDGNDATLNHTSAANENGNSYINNTANANGSGDAGINRVVNTFGGNCQVRDAVTAQSGLAQVTYAATAYHNRGVVNIGAAGFGGDAPQAYNHNLSTGGSSASHTLIAQTLNNDTNDGYAVMTLQSVARSSNKNARLSLYAICSKATLTGWGDGFPNDGDGGGETSDDLVSQAGIDITADGKVNITGDLIVSGSVKSGSDSLAEPRESAQEPVSAPAAPKMGRGSFKGNGTSVVGFTIPHPTGVPDCEFVASPRGEWSGVIHADDNVNDGDSLSLRATSISGDFIEGCEYHFSYFASEAS